MFKFYLGHHVSLPVFFPFPVILVENSVHTLNLRQAILYDLDRTKVYWKDNRLLLCWWGPKKGRAVSPQSLSRWVVSTKLTAYRILGQPCPLVIKTHSTRSISSSAAFSSFCSDSYLIIQRHLCMPLCTWPAIEKGWKVCITFPVSVKSLLHQLRWIAC